MHDTEIRPDTGVEKYNAEKETETNESTQAGLRRETPCEMQCWRETKQCGKCRVNVATLTMALRWKYKTNKTPKMLATLAKTQDLKVVQSLRVDRVVRRQTIVGHVGVSRRHRRVREPHRC